MFEPNENLDVQVHEVKDKKVVIIDNFYKNPDEIRQRIHDAGFANIKERGLSREESHGLITGLPGERLFLPDREPKDKLQETIRDIVDKIYGDYRGKGEGGDFDDKWDRIGFMCNIINTKTLTEFPGGIVPHQDYYSHESWVDNNSFGAVCYMNTPEECAGGTSFYSFNDQVSIEIRDDFGIPTPLKHWQITREEGFNHINESIHNDVPPWKEEFHAEMKYNRFVLYNADLLHSQRIDLDMFKDYNRINQVFFM